MQQRARKENKNQLFSESVFTAATTQDRENSEISRLKQENKVLLERCSSLELRLNLILRSLSWRVTAPLRRSSELRRELTPLLRWGSLMLQMKPRNTFEANNVCFCSSYLLLPELKGNVMPDSWVELHYTLQSDRPHQPFFLYYDTGTGFSGDGRFLLTCEQGTNKRIVFRLPEGVINLRLDPFDATTPFALSDLKLKPLGKAQVLQRWARNAYGKNGKTTPASIYRKVRKVAAILRSGGMPALKARLKGAEFSHDYNRWVNTYDTLSEKDFEAMRTHIFERTPCISIIMPTFNTPAWALRKALDSVIAQTYNQWELCIADDASTAADTLKVLAEYAKKDSRIKVVYRSKNGHISEASNTALESASGEFVALFDHDDELSPHALFTVVKAMNDNSKACFFYSDEDKITEEGLRHNPHFKSDWNPELLLSQNYVCHFAVISTAVVRAVGGFHTGFEGAQDWDLFLRVSEQVAESAIVHIPHILYHWRAMSGSTAAGTCHKPYVMAAQKAAVEGHLARKKVKAKVSILEDISQLRVTFSIPEPQPHVSLIIPTRDQVDILRVCIESILKKTTYKSFNIIIIDNGSKKTETFAYFDLIQRDDRIEVFRDEKPFNFSRLNNDAVSRVTSPLIGFINNDIEVIEPKWLDEMVSYAIRPEIGAVGARLLYPHGLLQHGGVILGVGGVAGHSHKGRMRHDVGYFNRIILPQNLSAVTAACMVVRREVFKEVEGFDEDTLAVAFNDVDLCLRIRGKGYRNVYNPHAECFHHESVSRGYETTPEKFARFESELATMQRRWAHVLSNDPYYNPNLTITAEDFGFAFPPRTRKAWGV
jgi:O-antigen biosynthesis protein